MRPLAQAELQVQVRIKQTDMRTAQHELKHVTKEKDNLMKRHKKRQNVVKVLQSALPGLHTQKDTLTHDLESSQSLLRKQGEVRH